ncbi:hypothetical protein CCR75_002275 [Bremia lactucae]|uniref:Fe2OG dioxygenase domain-containing protein n=1 Tax=Bremia lactucae TaxID=4779 RepID=A0A976IF48_BRELC|nr:hypothetical protein CCR75_002275 [Bremia lactucae]
MLALPIVDFSSSNASEQLRAACTDVGFFYLINHGISSVLISQVDEMGLPLHGPNIFPDKAQFPTFQVTMATYYVAMCELGYKVAQLFAKAAGEAEIFDQPGMFDKPMAALRLLHYAPEKSDVANGVFGAGAHTDYGLLTLLSTDLSEGLQIFYKNQWIKVPPRQDAFVVNLGDMAERFTNGIFKSTLHRVVNQSGKERYSVPFFYEPNFTCQVECFPSCVTETNPAKYLPTTSGQHLLKMYRRTHASFEEPRDMATRENDHKMGLF